MRINMVSIGSTGDVRPYVLLGSELKRRGHEVTIVAFGNLNRWPGTRDWVFPRWRGT